MGVWVGVGRWTPALSGQRELHRGCHAQSRPPVTTWKEHLRYRQEQIPSKAQDCWVLRCTKARRQTRTGLGATSLLAPPPGHLLQAPGPLSGAPGFSQPPGQHRVLWGRELAKLVLVVPSFHSLTHMLSHTHTHAVSHTFWTHHRARLCSLGDLSSHSHSSLCSLDQYQANCDGWQGVA